MAPGRYHSMGAEVMLEENGHLYNPATGYMAGSSATMCTCAKHLASLDLVTEEELVRMVWHNPLKLIGLSPNEIQAEDSVGLSDRPRVIGHQA
jgi:N-acetylglucosamine-6-phosphate deacetylase